MGLKSAIKAFFKALKDEKSAQLFIEGKEEPKKEGDASHLRLLAALQRSGRIVDFFKEDISAYSDAQIGSAARKIHTECAKTLEELVTIRPLLAEKEGADIIIPQGYNPQEIKMIGNVKGSPPYKGTLRHKGWCVHKYSLPKDKMDSSVKVLCPAEVEVV